MTTTVLAAAALLVLLALLISAGRPALRYLWALVLLLFVGWQPAAAQETTPVQYRLTRTTPAPTATYVFQRSAMTCNLPPGLPASTGLRIDDPVNPGRDCELLGNANGVIVPRPAGATHVYSIAGGDVTGTLWSAEVPMTNLVPPTVPANPRLRPPFAGVAVFGTIQQRFPFAGLDVVRLALEGTRDEFHLGALTLTVPGYSPQPGDWVQVVMSRNFGQ